MLVSVTSQTFISQCSRCSPTREVFIPLLFLSIFRQFAWRRANFNSTSVTHSSPSLKKRKLSNDNKTVKSLFVLFICVISQVLNIKDKPPVTTQFNLSGVADISRMLVVHLNSNNLLGVQLIKQLGGRHCPLDIIITCNRIAAGHGRYTHIAPLCMYIYRRS